MELTSIFNDVDNSSANALMRSLVCRAFVFALHPVAADRRHFVRARFAQAMPLRSRAQKDGNALCFSPMKVDATTYDEKPMSEAPYSISKYCPLKGCQHSISAHAWSKISATLFQRSTSLSHAVAASFSVSHVTSAMLL